MIRYTLRGGFVFVLAEFLDLARITPWFTGSTNITTEKN